MPIGVRKDHCMMIVHLLVPLLTLFSIVESYVFACASVPRLPLGRRVMSCFLKLTPPLPITPSLLVGVGRTSSPVRIVPSSFSITPSCRCRSHSSSTGSCLPSSSIAPSRWLVPLVPSSSGRLGCAFPVSRSLSSPLSVPPSLSEIAPPRLPIVPS